MSYSSLPKFITIRFRLHRVIPVYNNSSKDRLKVVDLSYFGSRTRKTTSLSDAEVLEDIVEGFLTTDLSTSDFAKFL